MIKEVEDLINYSASISFREIYFHKDENNNMCTCCSTANLTFMHSIIAIASERKKVINCSPILFFIINNFNNNIIDRRCYSLLRTYLQLGDQ